MTTSITEIKERVGPGDGVTTSFSISVPMLDVSYARVQIINRADETPVDLERGAGSDEFQVSLANDYKSVTITLGVAAAAMFDADHDMLVYRVTPLTQPVSVPYDNELPPKTQERVYDRLVQMLQELYDRSVRGISLPIGAPVDFNGEISSLTPRRAIIVNAAGDGFELSDFDPDVFGNADAAATTAQAAAAAAQDALDTIEEIKSSFAFKASRSTGQSISAGATQKVQCDVEEFDAGNCYDATTNYRYQPTKAGYYHINARLRYGSYASNLNTPILYIYKNGSAYASYGNFVENDGNTGPVQMQVSTLVYLNGTTDYVEMYVSNPVGGPISTDAGSSLEFSGNLVGI